MLLNLEFCEPLFIVVLSVLRFTTYDNPFGAFTQISCENYFKNVKSLAVARGHDRMVVGFAITYAINATIVSSNPTQTRCTRYNNVIKSVSDLWQDGCFLQFNKCKWC